MTTLLGAASLVVAAILGAACSDSYSASTRELDAGSDAGREPLDCADAAQPVDTSNVVPVPATEEQLRAFRRALGPAGTADVTYPSDVDGIVKSLPLAILGVLGPASLGRKLYSGSCCYDSRVNIEIRDVQILKGELPEPMRNAYLEYPWANDLGVTELANATPVGARVIILGGRVKDALESARQLEEEQIVCAIAGVRDNLLGAAPYGFLIEGVDGQTYAPRWYEGAPLVRNGGEELMTFEGALNAIRAALER